MVFFFSYDDDDVIIHSDATIQSPAVMSDHEVKLTTGVGIASENANNGQTNGPLSAEPQSLGNYAVPAQVTSSTPPPVVSSPPVPVPYRG